MARRGWVSAQTGQDTWHRLSVFDDGWVELPGMARTMSDTRQNLRAKLFGALIPLGILALLVVNAVLASRLDLPAVWLIVPGLLLALGLLGWSVYFSIFELRRGWRNRDQLEGDRRQSRAMRASGRQIKRVPGAPLFRRAQTAEEFTRWLDGVTHVPVTGIVEVFAVLDGETHVVTVSLTGGRERKYRSPDARLPELLRGLRPEITFGHY